MFEPELTGSGVQYQRPHPLNRGREKAKILLNLAEAVKARWIYPGDWRSDGRRKAAASINFQMEKGKVPWQQISSY